MHKKDQQESLFWCNLLHPIIFGEVEDGEVNQYLKNLAQSERLFPDGKRKKASLSTLRRKLRIYQAQGFEGLFRKNRSDKGQIRAVGQEVLDRAIALKKDQPYRSDYVINQFLESEYQQTITKSTLYRHLKKSGATKIKLGINKEKVRKRWSRDNTHDLWVGDFEEGPYVMEQGQVLPTYLSLFIDCYSRYVVEGRYYLRQSFDILIDSLLRAWSIHGVCKEIYVDNAKIYHADRLKAACYKLNIKLTHRPPRDPATGGLVEKVFQSCQSQFESEVRVGDILTLNQLNQAFSAYLSIGYHQKIHSETKQTPKERYQQGLTVIRKVDVQEVIKYFMQEEFRIVNKVFSDVQLNGLFFRVDPKLRGDKVKVHYDPYDTLEKVFIYSLDDQYLCQGLRYEREQGVKDQKDEKSQKPKYSFLDLLQEKHEKQMQQLARGIDYRQIKEPMKWPFLSFIQKLAKLMGRNTGISSFSAQELETLKKNYNRFSKLDETMLLTAWEKSSFKSIPHLILQLQLLAIEGDC